MSFQRCNWFDAVAKECEDVSKRVAIADLSVFSKFRISGSGASEFMQHLGANRPPKNTGDITLTHVLTKSGGVACEFTVTRLADEAYYLVSAAAAERHDEMVLGERVAEFNASVDQQHITMENLTDQTAVLGVMGPKAEALLSELGGRQFRPVSLSLANQQTGHCWWS